MFYILRQQTLEECLPQRVCGSSCCDAYGQCPDITDDKTADEQVNEIEDQLVDLVSQLLGIASILFRSIPVDRTC